MIDRTEDSGQENEPNCHGCGWLPGQTVVLWNLCNLVGRRCLLGKHQYEHVRDQDRTGVDDDQRERHEFRFKQQKQPR